MRNKPPTPRRVRTAQESKSATVRAAAAAPSRRQLSHWQREQQQHRTLFLAVGVLAIVVLAVFVGGYVYDNVIRASQVVAQVDAESITAAQLLEEVRPQASAIDTQAKQLGGGANVASYVNNQKRSLADQVLNEMIDDSIIRQEATRRGISVSPADVDDKERQTVATFQAATNPAPTPEPSPTAEASATSETALTSATPQATLAPTPVVFTSPTAVPTLETSAYATALQQLLDRNSLTEADLRTQLERSLLRERVQASMGQEQFPDVQDQVHVRQLVVAGADQANDLLSQLQGGADFAQLAQQFSTDTATRSNGGDMGWLSHGSQSSKPLVDAAFALQPGQLSDVIQDPAGYHILQLVEHNPARAVPPDQLTTQRQKAFSDWLSAQRTSTNVKLSLDQGEKDWILARIGVRP